MVLALCTSSNVCLYFFEVSWRYLEWFSSYRANGFCHWNGYLQSTKGHNSTNIYPRFMVLALCTSSNVDNYFCDVPWGYLERFSRYSADTNKWQTDRQKRPTDRQTGRQADRQTYRQTDRQRQTDRRPLQKQYVQDPEVERLEWFSSYRANGFCHWNGYLQSTKGHNSTNIYRRFMVFALCTSSNVDNYFCDVPWGYLERFSSYSAAPRISDRQTDKQTDRTDRETDRQAGRQTDIQTYRQTDRQTDRDRQTDW